MNSGVKYNKLTPVKASINAYRDALEFVFDEKNDDVTNIAIAGPYGSGKSSLANAICDSFRDHEFMTISLTHFNENPTISRRVKRKDNKTHDSEIVSSDDADFTKRGNDLQREIEGEILNQLIQLSDPNKILASRFRKTVQPGWTDKVRALLPILLVVIGTCVGLDLTLLTQLEWPFDVLFRTAGWGMVIFSLLYVGSRWLDRGGISRQIKRIGFKGSEIEVFDQAADSIFDKYADDILYIFDNCGKDVVMFEDLDRFCDQRVFEKLREINRLVNERRNEEMQADKRSAKLWGSVNPEAERVKPLRFFYLIGDDLFLSNERTKFFDFVVPVLPYVDRGNAAAKLETTLNESGVVLSRAIVEDVSLFIDDARTVYNIGNEFLMLRNVVGMTAFQAESRLNADWSSEEDEKLFALVVYKNVFPHDFALLQNRRGYLHALLCMRGDLEEEALYKMEARREDLRDRLMKSSKEVASSVAALQLEFLAPNLIQLPYNYNTYQSVAQKWSKSEEYDPNAFFDELITADDSHGLIKTALERINSREEYVTRKQAIEDKANKVRTILLNELAEISEREMSIRALPLAELFLEVDDSNLNHFMLQAVTDNSADDGGLDKDHVCSMVSDMHFDLVRILIVNGYIDESYERYMSVFQPGILSENDDMFLKRVAARKTPSPDYELEDPRLVFDRIEPFRFAQVSVRNHSLVKQLVKSGDAEKAGLFVESLKNDNDVEYVAAFALSTHYVAEFFDAVGDLWPDMPEKAFASMKLNDEILHRFAHLLIADGAMSDDRWGECPSFYEFVNSDEGFLVVEGSLAERIRVAVPLLDMLAIRHIEIPDANPALLNAVYEYGRYAPSVDAICSMLKLRCGEATACAANVLLLAGRHIGEPLGAFVETNLVDVIKDWLGVQVLEIDIDEGTACWILNTRKLDVDDASRFSSKLPHGLITNLSSVSDHRYWAGIIEADAVSASASNTLAYIVDSEGEFDNVISEFVNRHGPLRLEAGVLAGYYDDPSDFCAAVMEASSLVIAYAVELIESANVVISDLSACPTSSELVSELVERRLIEANAENAAHIRSDYPSCYARFVEVNIQAFLGMLNDGLMTLKVEEVRTLLKRQNISEEAQLELIKKTGFLFAVSPSYSDAANIAILNESFDESSLVLLPGIYENGSDDLKAEIDAFYCQRATAGVHLGDELPLNSCYAIMRDQEATLKQKRLVLARYVGDYSREEVVGLLQALNESVLAAIVKAELQQAKIELEPGIRELVTAMQNAGYCGGDSPIGAEAIMLHSVKWK